MGHLICDKMYASLQWRVVFSVHTQIQMDQSELRMKPPCEKRFRGSGHRHITKAEEVNFLFFMSLLTAEAHVFGVKFNGLYGTVGFIVIWDFSF